MKLQLNKKLIILITLVILCSILISGCIDTTQEQVQEQIEEPINLPTPTQGTITIKGIGISETEIKVSDLHKLPYVTREVTLHKGRPDRERTFKVTGPLLDTVLMEKFGLSQKTIDGIRFSALDNYSIEVPKHILQNREIILAYLTNCKRYTGGEWRAFTKGDEHWPIRVVVPDERGMFWVRMLTTIEIVGMPELNINQIVLFETKIATLNQTLCSENTYKVVRNNEFFKDALKQGYEFVRLKAVDGLDRNENLETFNNAYIRITGEDAPRFYSPDLPRGMHVRYLFHFSAGNTTYFVLSRAFERLDTQTIEGKEGLSLIAIMEEVGIKESNQYILNTVDGTYITITRNELTKGIVYKEADGTVSILFERLPKYSLSGLLSINAKE